MDKISYNPEKYIKGQPEPIPISTLKILILLSENCICKIECSNQTGTGFLILLNMDSQHSVKALLTNNHVLNKDSILPGKMIYISMNNERKKFKIKLDKERKVYTSEKYDITMIQIKKKDNLNTNIFFEIDNDIYQDLSFFKNKPISLLHYPKGEDMNYSLGIIKIIAEDNFNILHTCSTDPGSSGGPIFNKKNFKVIGIHKGANQKININYGTLLKEPIEEYKKFFNKKDIENLDKVDNRINEFITGNINDGNNNLNDNISENDEILIQYKITDLENFYSENVDIFNSIFVKNNKSHCKIIFNNNEYDLTSQLRINKNHLNENNIFEIILKGVNNINTMSRMFHSDSGRIPLYSFQFISKLNNQCLTSMDYMFSECKLLSNLSNISYLDTKYVTNMSFIFNNCESLSSLPDISSWNTEKVTNMKYLFNGCKSLTSLPDISKWDTKNVTKMNSIFSDCISLKFLPDISKWNTESIKEMNEMFHNCKNLASLPDISKWIIPYSFYSINMRGIFSFCESLSDLPDISKWDTSSVGNMSYMFCGCKSLEFIPNISDWKTIRVSNISNMFCGCTSLRDLPDISKWNTSSVMDMSRLFYDCKLLSVLPDISKWETHNVTDISEMFYNCKSLRELPNISNWKFKSLENKKDMFVGCNKKIIPKKFKNNCYLI